MGNGWGWLGIAGNGLSLGDWIVGWTGPRTPQVPDINPAPATPGTKERTRSHSLALNSPSHSPHTAPSPSHPTQSRLIPPKSHRRHPTIPHAIPLKPSTTHHRPYPSISTPHPFPFPQVLIPPSPPSTDRLPPHYPPHHSSTPSLGEGIADSGQHPHLIVRRPSSPQLRHAPLHQATYLQSERACVRARADVNPYPPLTPPLPSRRPRKTDHLQHHHVHRHYY